MLKPQSVFQHRRERVDGTIYHIMNEPKRAIDYGKPPPRKSRPTMLAGYAAVFGVFVGLIGGLILLISITELVRICMDGDYTDVSRWIRCSAGLACGAFCAFMMFRWLNDPSEPSDGEPT